MEPSGNRRAGLALAGWLLSGAVLVRLAWLPGPPVLQPWSALQQQTPTRTLPLLLALAVLATGLWVTVTAVLTLLAQLPGAAGVAALAVLRRVSPAFLRRAVEVALGLTAALTATAGVAQASAVPTGRAAAVQPAVAAVHAPTPATGAVTLDRPAAAPAAPLPALDRPAASPPAPSLDRPSDPARGLGLVSPPGPRTLAHQAHAVRVLAGDSLWRIAARALPAGADDAQIERAWHRWYASNRAVIGDDPALLHPGQLLTPPQP